MAEISLPKGSGKRSKTVKSQGKASEKSGILKRILSANPEI